MGMRECLPIAAALLLLAVPSYSLAQPGLGVCGTPPRSGDGVVWRGTERLGLRELAGLLAPVLWFSADEPLLAEGHAPIPAPHPCDARSDRAVVYYQVTQLTYRGDVPVTRPEEDDPAFADNVASFILKYYFYYPEDSGVGGHTHDLESVEFEVRLEREAGCRQVRVASVEGLAHGSRWYSNTLKSRPDTKYPLTLFVEEGKHATAPDRNADGSFMRGYDVTERVNDAWGVRDSLGQGVLLSSGYDAEMTKPRTPEYRLFPPESVHLQTLTARQRSYWDDQPSLGRYELRASNVVPVCAGIQDETRLLGMMATHRFGAEEPPTQYRSDTITPALSELTRPDSWLSVSLRGTERTLGAAMILKGLDLREGWIVPRMTVSARDASGEFLFTPSASRWADYYVSGGVRRQFVTTRATRTIETEQGRQEVEVVTPPNWTVVFESGFRFRARLPPKVRPFVLGYSFSGMRLGLQALGFSRVDQLRFVWEIGAGAW